MFIIGYFYEMEIRDIQFFNELATTKNLTRAAERLGLAQPSLSAWLVKVEDQLGTKLFHRSKKGLELTDSGQRFLEKSNELLVQWQNLFKYVQEGSESQKVVYRFGCHESVALYSFFKFMPILSKNLPQVSLQLKHDLSRRICEDIVSDRLDIGLAINPNRHPDLVIRKIGLDEVKFWQTKNFTNTSLLLCDPEMKQAQNLMSSWNKKYKPFTEFMNTSSLELCAQLCAEGIGIAILPTRVAQKYKNLIPTKDTPIFKDELCLVFKTGFNRSKYARELIDIILSAGI